MTGHASPSQWNARAFRKRRMEDENVDENGKIASSRDPKNVFHDK